MRAPPDSAMDIRQGSGKVLEMADLEHFDSEGASPSAPLELDLVLADLERLRMTIIEAWRDSAVLLVDHERKRLREEIRATCEMLITLTSR